MSLENYFVGAIERFKKLDKKTEKSKREIREIYYQFQLAKDYGELNTPTQEKIERLFRDIRGRF